MEKEQPNPILTQEPAKELPKKWGKISLLSLLAILLVFIGYQLGQGKYAPPSTSTQTSYPSSVPLSPTKEALLQDSDIPIRENTVSFTRANETVYLRYKGKIYHETEDPAYNTSGVVNLPNANSYTWHGLVDGPITVSDYDEIFSFKVFPNKQNFIFVTRWDSHNGWDLKVFYYNSLDPEKISNPVSFVWPEEKGYPVPKIDQVSSDEKYVSFKMFGCWNCGGHQPETLLLNLQTNVKKNIGKTSYFAWKTSGSYEYKEYVVKECAEPTPGECSEDPINLPLKTEQF